MTADDVGNPTVSGLWRLLDELHETGFSRDPRDLTNNLGMLSGTIERAWSIAGEPPPDAPEAGAAAASWHRIGLAMSAHAGDLRALGVAGKRSGPATASGGVSGDRLATCYRAAADLADQAHRSLSEYASEIAAARRRHGEMSDHLRAAAARLHPCEPRRIGQVLDEAVAQTTEGICAAIEAYTLAEAATRECEETLGGIAERMPFPRRPAGPPPV